ncbi:MAG: tetratricopeptide repeat protein [Syntrophorhabdales bacterium]
MYLTFYGLKKQPFHITPDPEFLYLSPSHKEALAAIIYGIEERKGFVAITGAVGVGKTTILRSYLKMKNNEHLKTIYVFNAKLTFQGLLKTIYQELGLPIESNSSMEMVNRLYDFLLEEYRQGNTVVLVIDEAQNMPTDTLENLRMMSNFETSKDKLLQIVLVGQPEFDKKLNMEGLRQLKQRLAVRATIQPLSSAESLEYVRFRLKLAGNDLASVFTTPALKEIIRTSKGSPRVLNVLCDNALITGFGYRRKPVTKKIAKEVIRDFADEGGPHSVRRLLPHAAALALLLLLFFGITWFLPLKRVPFDRMATSVSQKLIEKVGAIRGVKPMEHTAAKEREVLARAEPEAPPHKDESVVPGTLAGKGADVLLGTEPTGENLDKKAATGPTAEHSLLRDSNGKVCGLWLFNPADAKDRRLIIALLVKHGLPVATLLKHGYRIVPNKYDNAGGSFVMFGSSTAPGEAVAATQDDAARASREPVRINPEDATTHYNTGVALYNKGLTDEAIQAYREALRINPANANAYTNLGVALYNKGLTDEAIQAYREALRINPAYALAYYNLGLALKDKGLTDEAIQAYREALRINPEYALAYLNLGLALKDKGLSIQAVTAFESFIKYAPPPYAGDVEQVRGLVNSLKGNRRAKE